MSDRNAPFRCVPTLTSNSGVGVSSQVTSQVLGYLYESLENVRLWKQDDFLLPDAQYLITTTYRRI